MANRGENWPVLFKVTIVDTSVRCTSRTFLASFPAEGRLHCSAKCVLSGFPQLSETSGADAQPLDNNHMSGRSLLTIVPEASDHSCFTQHTHRKRWFWRRRHRHL